MKNGFYEKNYLKNKLKKIKKEHKEYFEDGWPIFLIIITIFWGFLLNLLANIIHDYFKNNLIYVVIVLFFTILISSNLIRFFYTWFYLPYRKSF